MREVFGQAPPGEREGAMALGGTRWGVVRDVVLPFGQGGIIGGSMLGLDEHWARPSLSPSLSRRPLMPSGPSLNRDQTASLLSSLSSSANQLRPELAP